MNLTKRIAALAGAGAAAVMLGGALGLSHTATPVSAGAANQIAVGCVNNNDPTTIQFNYTTVGGFGSQLNTGAVAPFPALAAGAFGANLNVLNPAGVATCDVLAADAATDTDGKAGTIDGGTFTYVLNGGIVNTLQILESNGPQAQVQCGNATVPPVAIPPAPQLTNESCQAMQPVPPTTDPPAGGTGVFSGAPGNAIHVGFRPGVTFPVIGSATPSLSLTVTYNRFPALGAAAAGPAATNIGFLLPAYYLSLTPNPATIPAQTQAAGGTGSVITASLFHVSLGAAVCTPIIAGSPFQICTTAGAIVAAAPATSLIAGAEPGVVTLTTSAGVFGATSASPQANAGIGASQVVSVHCGAIPGVAPLILLPTTGFNINGPGYAFNQCLTVSATLYGGGAAGTATITGNYVGDYTGATAQQATTVFLTPAALTVALTTGCNEVITPSYLAAGTTTSAVAALASGFSVASIWQFSNSLHAFQAGFFSVAGAPTNFGTVGPSQSIFICGSGTGTFPQG